ncbi:unnamed protein product [Amoebophrya sp. A120]|nr:unnamed protein product [Amoebophrya sp. A120]|eukprot:GSA120T00008943001.1
MQQEAEQAMVAAGFEKAVAVKVAQKMAAKGENPEGELDEETRMCAINAGILTTEQVGDSPMTMRDLTSKLMEVQSQCFIQSLSPTSFVNYANERDNLGGLSMLQSAAMTSLKSGIMSGAVPISDLTSTGFTNFDPAMMEELGLDKKEAAKKRIKDAAMKQV